MGRNNQSDYTQKRILLTFTPTQRYERSWKDYCKGDVA